MSRLRPFSRCFSALAIASVCLAARAEASTILYFHLDGTVEAAANGTGVILDSSSNGLNGDAGGTGGGPAPVYSSDTAGSVITDGLDGPILTLSNFSSLKFNTTGGATTNAGGRITVQDPVSNNLLLEPASFTIEAFIKTEDSVQFADIVGKARADAGGATWLMDNNNNSTLRVRTDHQTLGTGGTGVSGFNQGIASTATPNSNSLLGGWHHVATTYDQTTKTFKLFVDYQQVGSGTLGAGEQFLVYDDSALFIGQGAGGRAFDGWIDEVRYTDSVLTTNQFLRAVPEPGSAALLLLGTGLFAVRRRRGSR